jgi:flavorubredoxin
MADADTESITLSTRGPHSPEYSRQVANAAAEAVRVLNHATLNHAAEALRYPSDADAVIEALATMAARLPQLLEQIADWLSQQGADGRLAVTHGPYGGYPGEAVDDVRSWLSEAKECTAGLHYALDQARQTTAAISAGGE